ncbi:MAG: DUF5020 family protein [Calditrichia bacterium]
MKKTLFLIVFFVMNVTAEENFLSLNLQLHYDFKREHLTSTLEFFTTDEWGYTFCFTDVNFNHHVIPEATGKRGGMSDVYFELMRYFRLKKFKSWKLYATVQYDDGNEPIKQVWLAGLNAGDIQVGPLVISTEFLLKKEYKLGVNWQYTVVWNMELWNNRLVFNGFLDYWVNDVDNAHWPDFDPEIVASRYSFQAEPQIGYLITPRWKIGSEVEISRGFLGSTTGKLALEERYRHDKWYFLPTLFLQYNF